MSSPDAPARYDPWRDLAENWPQLEVVIEPMRGELLGELRYPVIALRAGTSSAQRRCTLAHELVHLERGVRDWGPWTAREELHVHREVARRLIPSDELVAALRSLGGGDDIAALARALDVDVQTARLRLDILTPAERARLRVLAAGELWRVA
jgi:Zn-dependent peptidase ImmA (M78 family)